MPSLQFWDLVSSKTQTKRHSGANGSHYFVHLGDYVISSFHSSLGKMTKRRNSQQKEEPEVILSATYPIDMDLSKMSEIQFRIAIKKLLVGLEKKQNTLENLVVKKQDLIRPKLKRV